MSSLVDSEASEASELSDDDEKSVASKSGQKNRAKFHDSSDSEEEEVDLANEEEICRKEGEGWIVDEEEEDAGGSSGSEEDSEDAEGDDRKNDKEDDEDDDVLDDEDFALIQENIGIDLKKKKRRLVLDDDEETDDEQSTAKKVAYATDHGREAIARQIFEDEDDEDVNASREAPNRTTSFGVTGDEEEEEDYDDMGDFIVDDRRGEVPTKATRRVVHKDAALQQAQDIFGVDFDLSEFEAFRKGPAAGDEYSEESEVEYSDDEESAAPARRKHRKPRSTLVLDEKVYELFDPSDLERAYFSQADERIRKTDIPERFQLRRFPVQAIDPSSPTYAQDLQDISDEADWIYRHAFKEEPDFKPISVIPKIVETLKLLRESLFEVPFINFYRKECVERDLNIKDLWRIYQLDEKWCMLHYRKRNIIQLLQKLHDFFDAAAPDDLGSLHKKHSASVLKLISCARGAESLEELADIRLNYLLHFAAYVEPMKRWFKRQQDSESAPKFAENVQDQYLRHDVDQCPMLPLDAAGDFLSPQFPTASSALSAARYMLAFQISREPFVRRMMRQMFQLQAVISVHPTPRGIKEIDESHPLRSIKYLNSKPVADLMGSPLFLHLHNASRDKLINYEVHVPAEQIRGLSLVDELQRFFHQDEFSSLVQAWNEQRSLVLKQAAEEFIFPTLIRELRDKMLESSQQAILGMCAKNLFNYLQVAPYPPDGHRSYDMDAENASSPFASARGKHGTRGPGDADSHVAGAVWSKGARVLAIAVKDEDDARQSIVSAVHLDSNGEVVDFLHLHGLMQSKRAQADFKNLKEKDMQRLSTFMVKHRPQVVVIGCDCRRALYLQEDIQRLVDELSAERRLPRIHVELMETELSIVFAQSTRASADMPASYSPLLRQAISLGRRLQDPLAEFAQLVNTEEEILGVRWHPLQDSLPRDKLLQALEIEFINRVNEVGVDVNRCLSHPHTAGMLQFVSGLGPRKSLHILKVCETVPARLRELDLDAFAEELKRQDHGDKHITLYDIRKELNNRYRDYRVPYQSANPELIFSMVTHETPETLHVGRLVEARVVSVATRRPRPEQLDNANPTKNESNGLWMCPFCRRDNFQFLNHVWSHFDNNECPGQPVGLRMELDNGIAGFIPVRNSDPPADKLFERAFPGSILQCRVVKIDITKFNVELTCKQHDLQDERHMWHSRPDPFYDYESEERDTLSEEAEKAKAKEKATPYLSRVIFHPYFKNISYDQLVAMEPELELGAIVIRPSRKGTDHLTVSWKVDDGILQHIDVLEREKTNSFSLGRLLLIGDEEFEDLDEIVARHVQPIVSLVRDIMSYRYYRDSRGGDRAMLGSLLQQEKANNPDRIPYFLSSMKERPGYFILAYMPNKTPHFEFFSVRPEGFRFRRLIFSTLDRMVTWFKEHYNDAVGGNYLREREYTQRSPRAPRTPQISYIHNPYGVAL
ncbi:Transcription elongation factor SPT6 [Paragonimus heterotremus]|uniref:Transcription elongation factor SPT6 n=1 Tax=Paragonimus heterotremus TaxID=100268 RepID=A0A8J4SMM7_9TREM|nr:Transcription elongation factor SPT6 [Paragonimus heterotremus]